MPWMDPGDIIKTVDERWEREKSSIRLNDNNNKGQYLNRSDAGRVEMLVAEFHVDNRDFPHKVTHQMGYVSIRGNLRVRSWNLHHQNHS